MYVNHCGINFTHHNFRIDRPRGSKDYLFLYIKTPAIFTFQGRDIVAPPNSVFLYKKDSEQCFRGAEEIYINDYIHFNTKDEEDEAFMQSLDLIYNTPLPLPNIYSFMSVQQQIVYETQNRSDWSEIAIDALLRYFLIKLVESMKLVREKYDINALERIHRLRNEIYKEPNRPWNIREMAKSVNFSPSYFQRMYKTAFNTSCMNDVIRARIELAKNLLIQTDLTSREIADQCGYQNETHFSRQFRQHTGVTPQEYRRI